MFGSGQSNSSESWCHFSCIFTAVVVFPECFIVVLCVCSCVCMFLWWFVCMCMSVCLPSSSSMHLATLGLLLNYNSIWFTTFCICLCVCVFRLWLFALKNKHFIISLEPLIMCSIRKSRDLGFGFLVLTVVFLSCGHYGPATNHKQSCLPASASDQSQTNLCPN